MSRTFTTATDDGLITLIETAQDRLAVIAPGLTTPVARALARRMRDLPDLSLTIILDADAEVYRMGYGDTEALEIIREASHKHMFDLREQPGVRIGVVISDDHTMVYAPVSRNIEAGSTTEDKPNAIMLHGGPAENLAKASGAEKGEREIGMAGMEPARVDEMVADLKANPPLPVNLTRKLTTFTTQVQYIELRMSNATFSSRKIKLPQHFQKFEDQSLRRNIESGLKIPIDLTTKLNISIESYRGKETLCMNEADIVQERKKIRRAFIHNWRGRGKIILRKDEERATKEFKRLEEIIKKYHEALKREFDICKKNFRERLVKEFLKSWMASPPDHLQRRGQTDEQACRQDIENEADMMFDKAVDLGAIESRIIYKDISIEDLEDRELMNGLRQLMEKAGVEQTIVRKLFETEDVIRAQNSPWES